MSFVRESPPTARVATRHNNFDAIRLLGAFLVVVGHAYILTGAGAELPVVLGEQIQTLGVIVFFSLSGYLITGSWLRFRRLRPYLLARVLRIGPALLVVVVLAAFVVGLAFTTLAPAVYLSEGETWQYLENAVLRFHATLPGVFAGNPHPDVNGSLWTLAPEFFCYLLLPALVANRRPRVALVLVCTMAVAFLVLPRTPLATTTVWAVHLGELGTLARYFFVGAAIAVVGELERVRRLLTPAVGILALLAVAVAAQIGSAVQGVAAMLLLPCAVIALGLPATPVVSSAGRFGDLSYGLYLWAFPVQQSLLQLVGVIPLWVDIVLVTAVSAALAWVSWHVVEAPAMRLRQRLRPGPVPMAPDGRGPAPRHSAA